MIIDGFQKLTVLDYPNKVACIIFTRGCNLRCPFCQNSPLIFSDQRPGDIDNDEVLAYLEKRKNILDGIVISGGEPTLQKDLETFLKKIKDIGLEVKLDTNGTNPEVLKNLIDKKLIDYVAMDIKNSLDNYEGITGVKIKTDKIKQSIKILKESKIDHEFRTTVVKNFITLNNLTSILKYIGTDSPYYLQKFVDSENVLEKKLQSYTQEEMIIMTNFLKENYPNVKYRNL